MEDGIVHILCVHEKKEQIVAFINALKANANIQVNYVESARFALERIEFQKIDAIAVAEKMSDADGVEFVEKVIKKNPMINCVMFSEKDHDDFHEATEGLGVLMQIPCNPGVKEAEAFMEKLRKIALLIDMKN